MSTLLENVPYCYLRKNVNGEYEVFYTIQVTAGLIPQPFNTPTFSDDVAYVEINLIESPSTTTQTLNDSVVLPAINPHNLTPLEKVDVYIHAYLNMDQPTKTGSTTILYADADEE